MDILIANLKKNATTLVQQVTRNSEAITQIREIRMDTVAPSITQRAYLLGLPRDVVPRSVLHVA